MKRKRKQKRTDSKVIQDDQSRSVQKTDQHVDSRPVLMDQESGT